MGQLIDDLLGFARLTRGEMRRSTVDLGEMAQQVVAALQENAPQRRVEVRIARGLNAAGDPNLLRVVLQNLLANAWKFSNKQSLAHIEFGARDENGETVFFVRDDGAGFDMAYANKLFGAFQRLHGAREFPGSGIGLAMAERIINRHGGRIWADAAVGKGATFYFTLEPERKS